MRIRDTRTNTDYGQAEEQSDGLGVRLEFVPTGCIGLRGMMLKDHGQRRSSSEADLEPSDEHGSWDGRAFRHQDLRTKGGSG